jgi:hypothetical protein
MGHHVELLTRQIGNVTNNWNAGFEETMRRIYHRWNDKPGYDARALRNARKYSPTP